MNYRYFYINISVSKNSPNGTESNLFSKPSATFFFFLRILIKQNLELYMTNITLKSDCFPRVALETLAFSVVANNSSCLMVPFLWHDRQCLVFLFYVFLSTLCIISHEI